MGRRHTRRHGCGESTRVGMQIPPCHEERVQLVAGEIDDVFFAGGFAAAEKFHRNFYHDEMEDYEVEGDRPIVHQFVHRMLSYTEQTATP